MIIFPLYQNMHLYVKMLFLDSLYYESLTYLTLVIISIRNIFLHRNPRYTQTSLQNLNIIK